MGEPKKKPGRSRKNGTDWELRRYRDAACGGDCIDSDWRGGDVFRENNRHSGEKEAYRQKWWIQADLEW